MRQVASAEQLTRAFKQKVSILDTIPAPVGGWNAIDPIANMPVHDAIRLENLFPRTASVALRGGATSWTTGFAARVKSFVAWNDPANAASKLFGCTDGGIYNATSSGAIGAAVTTLTNGKVYSTQMGLSGAANWLMCFNGTDAPRYFNGTAWTTITGVSTPALTTGPTLANLIFPYVFKRRLYLLEKNKLSFWFLAPDVVGGDMTEFQLGPLCNKGGYVVAMGSWTRDGGNGADDFAVFITSEGEVAVFSGSNPADATNFLLVGVYQIGRPLGRRCFMKLGGDLTVITNEGVVPLSKAITAGDRKLVAYTRKIQNAFAEAARIYGTYYGWEGTHYPAQQAIIFNVPTIEHSMAEQYVMNTVTGSWCKFTAWQASCFAVFGGELYYGAATSTVKAWNGTADFTANIQADAKTAFQYFARKGMMKKVNMVMPHIAADGNVDYLLGINADFKDSAPSGVATTVATTGGIWGTGLWGTALWGGALDVVKQWKTPEAEPGLCLALLLRIASKSIRFEWFATSYLYEPATGLPMVT